MSMTPTGLGPLRLPQGKGKDLSHLLNEAQVVLREKIPKVLKSEQYKTQRRALEESGRQAEQQLMSQLERAAEANTFSIQVTPAGVSIFTFDRRQPHDPRGVPEAGAGPETGPR